MNDPPVLLRPLVRDQAERAAWNSVKLTMRAIRAAGLHPDEFRLIGGAMVTLHLMRSGADLPVRATGDSDIGLPFKALADSKLTDVLDDLYDRRDGGNRWVCRTGRLEATVDVLVSAPVHHRKPVSHQGHQFDQAENLALAMRRPPVLVNVMIDDDEVLVSLPDVLGALALKLGARRVRSEIKDVEDIWRLLEVAHLEAVSPADFLAAFAPPDRAPMQPFTELRKLADNKNLSSGMDAAKAARLRQLAALYTAEPI